MEELGQKLHGTTVGTVRNGGAGGTVRDGGVMSEGHRDMVRYEGQWERQGVQSEMGGTVRNGEARSEIEKQRGKSKMKGSVRKGVMV